MHVVVTDLGFGDAGKGAVVDFLAATAPVRAVVRYSGGCQAAHNVITERGRHHTFAQVGAGAFRGAATFLSRFMLVEPLSLQIELDALRDVHPAVFVDREALLTTPFHWLVNRGRPWARLHGTCGRGIGETVDYSLKFPEDAPRVADLESPSVLWAKLGMLEEWYRHEIPDGKPVDVRQVWRDMLAVLSRVTLVDRSYLRWLLDDGDVVFEGSQGVLLDEWRGFHPHTTWSTTTRANADLLLSEANHEAHHLGVIRTHHTRHGSGPLPTYDPALPYREAHNDDAGWQGQFRVGHFDQVLFDYAVQASPVDSVALTHMDWESTFVCESYRQTDRLVLNPNLTDLDYQEGLTNLLSAAEPLYRHYGGNVALVGWLEEYGTPVEIASYGPSTVDKKRRWIRTAA